MDYWEELMLECKEMPTTTSAWCATQNNNVDVLQALLLTPDSTPPATTTLLAHLPPRQRIEIAKTFGSVWEEIAAHFDFTKQSIESEIVGGELATTIDKSKFLVEKLSKKGVTLQDMSTAMNQCELGGELKAKLSDILPQWKQKWAIVSNATKLYFFQEFSLWNGLKHNWNCGFLKSQALLQSPSAPKSCKISKIVYFDENDTESILRCRKSI